MARPTPRHASLSFVAFLILHLAKRAELRAAKEESRTRTNGERLQAGLLSEPSSEQEERMRFLMGRFDWGNSHYKTLAWAVPIDCCHCGSGKVFTEPPYHPNKPTTWRCAECRGQFSVHESG
jgi:hypothetical protein